MFHKFLTTVSVAALAAAGLLLPAAPAGAQQGWPIVGSNWSFGGGSNGYRSGGGGGYGFSSRGYSSGYYAPGPAYTYSTPAYTYSTPAYPYYMPTYTYFTPTYYPPLAQDGNSSLTAAEVKGARAAQIDVRLPAGATIWFGDAPTSQTGALRHFVSPPLDPGKDYVYQVKVRWQEDGQDVTRTREVEVHAGDRLDLSFGPRAAGAAQR